jgi:heat shock protein HslJ
MIEDMCNKILGNYTKKEDQLMTAAFGTRTKMKAESSNGCPEL